MRSIKVLAIDPSGHYKNKKATIGVAFCEWENLGERNILSSKDLKNLTLKQHTIESESDLELFYSNLRLSLGSGQIDMVVIEDYILYEGKVGMQTWQQQPTSKTIGVIEHLCREYNIPSHLQTASLVKLWTNYVLAAPIWGYLNKKGNSYMIREFKVSQNRHAMDAFRHNFYWILGENTKWKKNKT